MKKPQIIILAVILVLLIPAAIFAVTKLRSSNQPTDNQPTQQKKKVSKPVNEISIEERPYVVITPTLNREIDVTVKRLPKAAEAVEYLAEYQYGTSLGGNENIIDLATLPATKQFALYSRSAGGKTSFEEDVKGGDLTLMFQGADEYWLKQGWNYYDRVNAKSTTKESALTSRDGKFGISGADLKSAKYLVIYNSPGYPSELPGKAMSEVYTFQAAGLTSGEADVKIRMSEEGSASIYGWDGKAWKEFDTAVNGKEATATVDVMESYMVVGK